MTSSFAGTSHALSVALNEPRAKPFFEAIGGFGGGMFGGRLPDIIEPAITPRHRGPAHSLEAGVGAIWLSREVVPEWQAACRRLAEALTAKGTQFAAGSLQRMLCSFASIACYVFAGFLAGIGAGYVTHLVCDHGRPFLQALQNFTAVGLTL